MKQQPLLNIDPPEKQHAHSQVIVYFQECWKREKGGGSMPPLVQWKRDGKIVSDLLKQYPPEYVERLIRVFLTRQVFRMDEWCASRGWDIPAFLARVNRCIVIVEDDAKHQTYRVQIPTRAQATKMGAEELKKHIKKCRDAMETPGLAVKGVE